MLAKKLLLLGGLAVVLGTAGCAATCRTNPHDCLRSVEEVAVIAPARAKVYIFLMNGLFGLLNMVLNELFLVFLIDHLLLLFQSLVYFHLYYQHQQQRQLIHQEKQKSSFLKFLLNINDH